MPAIGYHASHEQFTPRALLAHLRAAELAGFARAMSSDHFMPWSEAQGESGFAWTWIGAALEATALPVGLITVPGHRYHPAIVAQAGATVATMYPGRFWLAVGSGERLNEHLTGARWPPKEERNARLRECYDIIRALWRGETVTHRGRVTVEEAKLYTRPPVSPPLYGAALTPETARWLGGFVDGLLTAQPSIAKLRRVVDAFREGGGEGKPIVLQVKVSYDLDDARARRGAFEQWRTVTFDSAMLAELSTPQQFDAAAQFVREEDMDAHVFVSSDLGRHIATLAELAALGFTEIHVHNVNREQQRFINAYGDHVLPAISRA